jgi:hypothetical protein
VAVPPLPGPLEVPLVCPPCWAITLEIARDAAAIRIIAGQIRITAASCSDWDYTPKAVSAARKPL